jgi:hypothetical protein
LGIDGERLEISCARREEQVLQRDGVVMCFIVRGEHQRDAAASRKRL